MKDIADYLWRESLAGTLWNELTPLGKLTIWVPGCVFIYLYLAVMYSISILEWVWDSVAGQTNIKPTLFRRK